ncbi:pitrilysin [Orbus mooreae]|uniref:pitrilysin n=1 Tax=Orbus mooreae TaxID=3074107 RepID=UPI00370D1809
MKNKYLFLVVYFIGVLFSVSTVYANEVKPYTVSNETINKSERDDRQYQLITLANQMKVLLISDSHAVKSLASLALPVGSLHDPKLQQGLAHYTEHMVLMGSKKYPEPSSFSEYLAQHSGSYNASTAAYRTAFYFEVENNAFNGALDRLADAIAEPLLNEINADKERNAVNAELTMARSNDGFRIGQVDSETMNQEHPAAMFSGGNLETLSDKPNSKLQTGLESFYNNNYSANIMVGVLYSDKSLPQLAELAVDTFGKIKNKSVVVEQTSQVALTPDTLGKWIYMQPAQPKKILYLQFSIENNLAKFADKSDEYISYMISNRSQNTLFDLLQKQGLIESISASSDPIRYGNSGVFGIYVTLTDRGLAEKEQVINAIFNYLQLLENNVDSRYYDELHNVLALDFKYPDITRDMSYVEDLSDKMLFYPAQHILDADNVATHFDKKAIEERLASLKPNKARIWVIAPNQPADKVAYFVDAPYQIENISQPELLAAKIVDSQLQLPSLNRYIPTEFIIPEATAASNKNGQFNSHGNHFHFFSDYFADEPKAVIALSLRNDWALSTGKNQVLFNLLDYLANRELATFRFQTAVAGINVSTQADSGLMIQASGFNQHLTDVVGDVINTYREFDINQEKLDLAKSWYLEQLATADHARSYQLALQPVNALSTAHYVEREQRRDELSSISLDDLIQYRDKLMVHSVPYMLSVGNLPYSQSYDFYKNVKDNLDATTSYTTDKQIQIAQDRDVLISQNANSTDNALLMGFVPKGYDKTTSRVASYLLYKIISPWFYDQLRSQEQLGYAVFSLPVNIGDSSGIGFLIQSNQYDPAYLNGRYKAFYPTILAKLNALSNSEFEQYRKAVIDEMLMPPQTLNEEFASYFVDYSNDLFSFDSREQKIARLSLLKKAELIEFYQKAVIDQDGLVLASQVLGNQPNNTVNSVTGLTQYQGAQDLQNRLLTD